MSDKFGLDKRFTGRGRRNYNIKALWEKHQEIARQVVLGRSNGAIAAELGCTPQIVSDVRNSPIGQAEIDRLSRGRDESVMSISQRIEDFAPVALELIEDIVQGRVPGASIALRAKLAGGQLARAGYGEVRKVQAMHAHLGRADIEAIKQRAQEVSEVIEAEVIRDSAE